MVRVTLSSPMRSPWVGSLALLAPANGFLAQPVVLRGGSTMLHAFVRPSAGAVRAVSSGGWRKDSLRLGQLQRVAPMRQSAAVGGTRMMAGGGGGGGGGGEGGGKQAKKAKVKKPESYYKQTVILPQTGFEQVRVRVC